jgi:SAM-dependent methyltransferase
MSKERRSQLEKQSESAMIEEYFENMLRQDGRHRENPEAFWDSRAEDFFKGQQSSSSTYPERIAGFFRKRGIITENSTVLEIGCGAGRYTIPFAKKVKKLVASDISSNMLGFMEETARSASLDNIEPVKADWKEADTRHPIMADRFDFVFSVQSPGTRDISAIMKMNRVSKGYCMIGQFARRRDELTEHIKATLQTPPHHDPHNNRERIISIFNLLWLRGLNPEITYFHEHDKTVFDYEEAVRYYAGRWGVGDGSQEELLRNAVSEKCRNGEITVKSDSTMALIFWKKVLQ